MSIDNINLCMIQENRKSGVKFILIAVEILHKVNENALKLQYESLEVNLSQQVIVKKFHCEKRIRTLIMVQNVHSLYHI